MADLNKLKLKIFSINNKDPVLGLNDLLYKIYIHQIEKTNKKQEQGDTQENNKYDDIMNKSLYKIGNYFALLWRKEIFYLLLYWDRKETKFCSKTISIEITKLIFTFFCLEINAKAVIKSFKIQNTMTQFVLFLNDQRSIETFKDSSLIFNSIQVLINQALLIYLLACYSKGFMK